MIVVIVGAAMYLVEGPEHGFTSIPVSVYWAVVTLTTVGYGDISPQTRSAASIAVFMMLLGLASSPCRPASSPPRCRAGHTDPSRLKPAGVRGGRARPRRAVLPQVRRETLTFRNGIRMPPAAKLPSEELVDHAPVGIDGLQPVLELRPVFAVGRHHVPSCCVPRRGRRDRSRWMMAADPATRKPRITPE